MQTNLETPRRWYDKKRFILPLLLFIFPVGVYFLWKSNGFSKEGKVGLTIAFTLFFFMYVAGSFLEPSKQNTQVVDNNLPERVEMEVEEGTVQFNNNGEEVGRTEEKSELQQTREQLERELSSEIFDNGIKPSSYEGSVDAIIIQLALFNYWGTIIKDAKKLNDKEITELSNKLTKKVSSLQIKELPKLRKAYVKQAAEKLWLKDIDMNVQGKGNNIINLTGSLFAANQNKQDFQEAMQDVLTNARFKQVRYRWYKGQDDYTYYDLTPPSDVTIYE